MLQKSLFATLIGINAYPKNPLNGCVRDALAMDSFLRKLCLQQGDAALTYVPAYFLAPHVEDRLLQEHAESHQGFKPSIILPPTFQNITSEAFAHLKQARDGDICLFYYSGHGSTIIAPEEFRGSKSKLQNETIVCLDSRTDARDLIDKEIAYLLWDALQGKNVHCIVIMDCCFAGNNTRAVEVDSKIGYRHTPDSKQQIPLQEYLGYQQGFYTPKSDGSVGIKIGRYVQLAASMDNQTAQETASNGGLFTSQLLEVLQKGGSARSYRDLMQTTRVSVRNRNPHQPPVEFAAEDRDLDQPFLGGNIIPVRPTFELRFDAVAQKWKLFGGKMDGLVSTPENPTEVKITGTDKVFKLESVFSNFSYLDARSEDLDKEQGDSYQAIITKYATPRLHLCVSNGILENAERMQALKSAYGDGTKFPYISLHFEKEKQDAPYQIRLSEDGTYVLVRTGSTIPLFKREREPKSFLNNADYVGKYLVVSELKNTNTHFKKEDFIFRLERIEGEKLTKYNLNTVVSELVNNDGQLPEEAVFQYKNGNQPAFRLSIAIHPNAQSLRSCYVGAIYLESKYGINTNLINSDANALTKGGAPVCLTFISDGTPYETIPLSVDSKYQLYNINEIASQLKIVVSEQPFNLDSYRQDNLKLDDSPKMTSRSSDFTLERQDEAPDQNAWCVFSTRFRIIGPHKSIALQGGTSADLSAFKIEAPEGFQALAYAGTGDDITKKLAEAKRSKSAQSTNAIAPPSDLFGDANTLDQAFTAGISGAANNNIQVLELRASEPGSEVVLPQGREIKITPKSALGKAETIVPFGYDEESGLYFPIGYTDQAGVVHIEQLPPPSEGIIEDLSTGGEKDKSLGGSIKRFFQKVAWSRLTGVKEYNRLSLHHRADDGHITEVVYFGSESSKDKAEQISKAVGRGAVLLLVHGIIGDTKGMVEAVFSSDALHRPFTGILSYDYENLNTGIEASAQKLKDMLQACGFGEERRLTIVAHSMGGLVSRYLIEHLEGDRFVKKLIQCGTPNSGSEMADFRRKLTGWLFAGLNGVSIFQPYMAAAAFLGKRLEKGLFRTLDQMDPDSPFLAQLNAAEKPRPGIPYYLVGGNTGDIKAQYPDDASLLERIFGVFKKRGIYTGLDLAVFDSDPNDMAVKVERMKHLPWGGHNSATIVDCDHVSYFVDAGSLGKIQDLLT